MELFETNKYYIIVNGSVALFCDRLSGHLSLEKSIELPYEWNPVCLGQINGVIGKINFVLDKEYKLILINKLESVGILPIIGQVYRITKISVISLNSQQISNLDIDLCPRHHFGLRNTEKITTSPESSKHIFKTFQKHIKSAAESVKPKKKNDKDKEKFERIMLEEFDKMFQETKNSTDCFYISRNLNESRDITSNIQRQNRKTYSLRNPLWQRADDRFFWNKAILKEAIDSAENLLIQEFGKSIFQGNNQLSETDINSAHTMVRDIEEMLMPIIQGFVQVEPFNLSVPSYSPLDFNAPNLPKFDKTFEYRLNVALISRRSRYRAGTRFRRRGVDANGNVANYVETEQILQVENGRCPHVVTFVQVRGSIPVFWSQFSLRYNPPIILDKSGDENQRAFRKHFEAEFELYEKVVIVNLVDTGLERSERKISDAYLQQIIKMNSPLVTCVMFDFHDYCSGLQFDNVSILIKGITEIFRDMKYTWVDKKGTICEQKSIFRVNCVDCLDRTNVVQCMLAGVVIETQLRKLGLLSPEESLPNDFHQTILIMWANNGDALSRQYSGTAAMKGDYTRTGTRTMNGLVRDGMSSVSRYYLRLKEISRQSALDLMTANDSSAEIITLRNGHSDTEQKLLKQKEENIKELIAQCKNACLKSNEECLAESILIYCDENEKEHRDMNTVVLLTSQMVYFISNLIPLPNHRIEFEQKQPPLVIGLSLQWIRKIQIGYESLLFRSNRPMLRIFYETPIRKTPRYPKKRLRNRLKRDKINDFADENIGRGCYMSFKQPSLRLFNNLLVEVRKGSDKVEALTAFAESLYLAINSSNPNVILEGTISKFDNVKCEPIPKEWIFPVNINMIYENIVLASSISELHYDYDEMMNITEDATDYLETNDRNMNGADNLFGDKGIFRPIDYIKNRIRRVRERVKSDDWNSPFTNSFNQIENDTTINEDSPDESNDIVNISYDVQKGTFEVGSQKLDENEIFNDSLFNNEDKALQIGTRNRYISASDDDILLRQSLERGSIGVRKVMSDLAKYNRSNRHSYSDPHAYSSGKHDASISSFKDGDFQRNINTNGGTLITGYDHQITSRIFDFSSNMHIENMLKDSVEEIVLESCGIINFPPKMSSIKNSPFLPIKISEQLTAATGVAYKRMAEQVSLQLSVDDSKPYSWLRDNVFKSSLLTQRLQRRGSLRESINNRLVVPHYDYTDDMLGSSHVNIETMEDLIGYIKMPPVDVSNVKMAERLTNKQIQLAYFIEGLRKKLLDSSETILSNMIIF